MLTVDEINSVPIDQLKLSSEQCLVRYRFERICNGLDKAA